MVLRHALHGLALPGSISSAEEVGKTPSATRVLDAEPALIFESQQIAARPPPGRATRASCSRGGLGLADGGARASHAAAALRALQSVDLAEDDGGHGGPATLRARRAGVAFGEHRYRGRAADPGTGGRKVLEDSGGIVETNSYQFPGRIKTFELLMICDHGDGDGDDDGDDGDGDDDDGDDDDDDVDVVVVVDDDDDDVR